MEFVPLREILPDMFAQETRMLAVLKETNGLPVGEYAFSESFCSNKNCDCRRAFINVICLEGELKGLHLATIGYGWESLKFYTQWMHGDSATAKMLTGVGLDERQIQSEFSEKALDAFLNSVLDEDYEERIKRHYAAFKSEIRRQAASDFPSEQFEPKASRNDPCPCDSGKKYKKCCGLHPFVDEPATDTAPNEDDALIESLFSEEDRLSRDVVDACIQRGQELVPPLTAIVRDSNHWQSDDKSFWAAVHATYILGAIGGVSAVNGLLTALRMAAAYRCDYVTEALPSIFGSIGAAALQGLRAIAADRSNEWFVRAIACDCLVAIALCDEKTQDSIFPFLADIFTDSEEDHVLRGLIGLNFLTCRRCEYREELMNFAQEEEQRKYDPENFDTIHFETSDVIFDLAETEPDLSFFEGNWLEFYDETAIQDRQKRWKSEQGLRGWISLWMFRVRLRLNRRRMQRDFEKFSEERSKRVQEILEKEDS